MVLWRVPGWPLLLLRTVLVSFRGRRDLVLENLALRHQLDVALRGEPRLRIQQRDRILWVWLRRLWPRGWRRHLVFVQPDTVVGWHRKGWRLYWTWRSRARLGRPRLSPEVRELIRLMSTENPLWGSECIRGELLKLGIVVSNRSIRRYRWRSPSPVGTQRWRSFLKNELKGIWAADLLVVQTVGFRTLYVFFVITHDRRELVHFNVTASPTAAWIWRQVLNATPWGRQATYLVHDRDAVYGRQFDAKLRRLGIVGIRTPVRAPRANSIAERVVRTFRQECLDHVIGIGEGHLHALLTEYVRYYNHERPHRSLGHQSPVPREVVRDGPIVSRPILGGLHHAYARAA